MEYVRDRSSGPDRVARSIRKEDVERWGSFVVAALSGAVLLLAAGCGGEGGSGGEAAPETSDHPSRLILAGIGELYVVDTATGSTRTIRRPELAPGDPPDYIAPVGESLAMWGYDVAAVPLHDLDGPAQTIASKGWIFVPGATGETIWVAYLDGTSEQTQRNRRLRRYEEIDEAGRVVASGRGPANGAWPAAALSEGLLHFSGRGLELRDPVAGTTLRRIDGWVGEIGPAYGNLLASCVESCGTLLVTDFEAGEKFEIPAPSGTRLEVRDASFSPDGGTLAVPVRRRGGGRLAASKYDRRLALFSLEDRRGRVVRGSSVPAGYIFTGFSPDGSEVFLSGGDRRTRAIVRYRLGARAAERLRIELPERYYDMVVD